MKISGSLRKNIQSYHINYVYGFSSRGFSYFLTTQLKNVNSSPTEYVSKLVRVCQNDTAYHSYTEIPIECIGDGTKYNLVQAAYLGKAGVDLPEQLKMDDDVLYAVFSEGIDNTPTNNSALCIYPLQSIRKKFMDNIQTCYRGIGKKGLVFTRPNHQCVETTMKIEENFCGSKINTQIDGEKAISVVSIATFQIQLTSITVTQTNSLTVLFIGTVSGHLKKVFVESATSAHEYDDIEIDENSSIKTDLQFDPKKQHLYVLTRRSVTKVTAYDCSTFSHCPQCPMSRDPFCKLCVLENRCNRADLVFSSLSSFMPAILIAIIISALFISSVWAVKRKFRIKFSKATDDNTVTLHSDIELENFSPISTDATRNTPYDRSHTLCIPQSTENMPSEVNTETQCDGTKDLPNSDEFELSARQLINVSENNAVTPHSDLELKILKDENNISASSTKSSSATSIKSSSAPSRIEFTTENVIQFDKIKNLEKFELPPEKLEIQENNVLGEGNFGIIKKGYIKRYDDTKEEVAVKTIQSDGVKKLVTNLNLLSIICFRLI